MGQVRIDRVWQGHVITVFDWCPVDEVATLAGRARESGARSATTGKGKESQTGRMLQKLLTNVSNKEQEKPPEKKVQKVVHLVSNLPPLAAKLVELIQECSFVDFSWFPVMDDGPSDSDWRQVKNESVEEASGGMSSRKRALREVPDILTWSTCFSLFQTAWGRSDPKMFETLMAYRESIVRLAKRHPWHLVVKYDRKFRQEAAGRSDVAWGEEKTSLVLDMMCNAPQTERQGHGNGPVQRKVEQKKRGVCFRYNKENSTCAYGKQCRFLHACAQCGGDHPGSQCHGKKL